MTDLKQAGEALGNLLQLYFDLEDEKRHTVNLHRPKAISDTRKALATLRELEGKVLVDEEKMFNMMCGCDECPVGNGCEIREYLNNNSGNPNYCRERILAYLQSREEE